jgi:hypothetical protein
VISLRADHKPNSICIKSFDTLIPTHNELRSKECLDYWLGVFTHNQYVISQHPAVKLSRTEDGCIYIHDGHHRLSAALLSNFPISLLRFEIVDFTYAQIAEINFDVGWVTPYNPRTHVRVHNLHIVKPYILALREFDELMAIDAIRCNFDMYAKPRRFSNLADICERFC